MEFTSDSKVVNTYKAKNVPKKKEEPEKPVKEEDEEIIPPIGKEAETSDNMTESEKQKEKRVSEEVSSLLNTYNSVLIVYNIGELKALNEYIHPAKGFTVMENSGAYVNLTWYNKIDSILDHPLMKIPQNRVSQNLKQRHFIVVNSKAGAKPAAIFQRLIHSQKNLSNSFVRIMKKTPW
ncbi:MAG: hypothetical protein IPG53_13720 [Ignavibacteriales bacterium]|nr:hypothetical protein [Ignavibacteriales bacterium]